MLKMNIEDKKRRLFYFKPSLFTYSDILCFAQNYIYLAVSCIEILDFSVILFAQTAEGNTTMRSIIKLIYQYNLRNAQIKLPKCPSEHLGYSRGSLFLNNYFVLIIAKEDAPIFAVLPSNVALPIV